MKLQLIAKDGQILKPVAIDSSEKVENLSYREFQKRNTKNFNALTKEQQKLARSMGYRNLGWANVRKSWMILHQILNTLDVKIKHHDRMVEQVLDECGF